MNTMMSDLSVVAGRCMEDALRYAYALGFDATVGLGLLAGLAAALGLARTVRPRRWSRPAMLLGRAVATAGRGRA